MIRFIAVVIIMVVLIEKSSAFSLQHTQDMDDSVDQQEKRSQSYSELKNFENLDGEKRSTEKRILGNLQQLTQRLQYLQNLMQTLQTMRETLAQFGK